MQVFHSIWCAAIRFMLIVFAMIVLVVLYSIFPLVVLSGLGLLCRNAMFVGDRYRSSEFCGVCAMKTL